MAKLPPENEKLRRCHIGAHCLGLLPCIVYMKPEPTLVLYLTDDVYTRWETSIVAEAPIDPGRHRAACTNTEAA